MADNTRVHKARARATGKDILKTGESPREKVTLAAPCSGTSEPAPSWTAASIAAEAAEVNYTPAVGETRVIPMHTPPPGAVENAIVSALVSIAQFARRKPGTSLALAAAAGLAAGLGVRRI